MTEKTTLEVGDVLYGRKYQRLFGRITIVRLTKTQAIADDNRRFKREIGYKIFEIGGGGWGSASWQLEDEKLKTEYARNAAIYKCSAVKWEELPLEKLTKVLEILNAE